GPFKLAEPALLLGGRRHEALDVQEQLRAVATEGQVFLDLQILFWSELVGLIGVQPVRVRVLLGIGERIRQRGEPVKVLGVLAHGYFLSFPGGCSTPSLAANRLRPWCRCALTVSMEIFISSAISSYLSPLS